MEYVDNYSYLPVFHNVINSPENEKKHWNILFSEKNAGFPRMVFIHISALWKTLWFIRKTRKKQKKV